MEPIVLLSNFERASNQKKNILISKQCMHGLKHRAISWAANTDKLLLGWTDCLQMYSYLKIEFCAIGTYEDSRWVTYIKVTSGSKPYHWTKPDSFPIWNKGKLYLRLGLQTKLARKNAHATLRNHSIDRCLVVFIFIFLSQHRFTWYISVGIFSQKLFQDRIFNLPRWYVRRNKSLT